MTDEQLDSFGGSVEWEQAVPPPPKEPEIEMTELVLRWMWEWNCPVSTHELIERFDKLGFKTAGIPSALVKLRNEKLIVRDDADLDPSAPSLKTGFRWHVL
ncbi:MAG: hypothetical protein RL272_1185 [Candidatus Parcubacteria bacterium]|jgi:hypothetical protein